ncbi:MAG: helix-turn-helix transcriptional regulator [Flavobacteriales bacterium]|nr:helix-turn-helix transcriptional regulator [Flavobacteriales bacterium]
MEDVFLIGKKLKHLREERKYTQEGVAIELGVGTSQAAITSEVLNVPSSVVVKASELYKVDLSYFYSLRGPVSITMNVRLPMVTWNSRTHCRQK